MNKIKINTSLMFVLLAPLFLFGQKYKVNGDYVIASDTTYYNYKSVNYIGDELKRIDNELDGLKKTISSSNENNLSQNNDANNKIIADIKAKVTSLENSLSSIRELQEDGKVKKGSKKGNNLWWFPWLGIFALGGLGALMYSKIKRSIPNKVTDHTNDIAMLKSKLTETTAEKQTVLASYINEQLELKAAVIKIENGLSEKPEPAVVSDTDHSLALKLADEINRMEKNLSLMDKSVKGHRQLVRGVSRLKDNLAAKGYEITELLGKPYNEGMRLSATYIMDETLDPGTQVITSVLKPQILFNDKLIQSAQIEVSQN